MKSGVPHLGGETGRVGMYMHRKGLTMMTAVLIYLCLIIYIQLLFILLVIANAASFHDIEADWNWLAKYLLETLGKLESNTNSDYHILYRYIS